jgi:hypothetical protein
LIRYKIKPHFKGQSPDKRNGEVYGEFLSSRFSKALGFFADDEWVADVNCPDCEKSLTKKFQGRAVESISTAAGIETLFGTRDRREIVTAKTPWAQRRTCEATAK